MKQYVDPQGREWVRPAEAVDRLPSVSRGQLKMWVHRGYVHKVRVGKDSWLLWDDILRQERKTRGMRG